MVIVSSAKVVIICELYVRICLFYLDSNVLMMIMVSFVFL